MFTPPPLELPKFFDVSEPIQDWQAGCNGNNDHKSNAGRNAGHESKIEQSKEESNAGLDSFFDDFTLAPKPPSNDTQKKGKQKKHTDNDQQVLVSYKLLALSASSVAFA